MLDLEWPYKRHTEVFVGAQQYAREQGWNSVIDEYADSKRPAKQPPYDGIIARATQKLARKSARENVPVVNVWVNSPAANSLPGVFPDHEAVGRLRARHLLDRGFSRFAVLTTRESRAHAIETEAFLETLEEHGYDCLTTQVSIDAYATLTTWRETERVVNAWVESWETPIGVFVAVESHGRMVAQICHNNGLRVPQDVAIVTGWNEEHYCEGLEPTLSSVEVGFTNVGYEAARLLDRLMKGGKPPSEPILLPPTGLVVRESTDFVTVDNALVHRALEFIAANSSRSIGPDDVAEAVKTGTRTLQRRFHEHLDRTIAAEIRRVRIERAKRELAHTSRSVAQIARTSGFGESMRMYEVFRRELGVSPSEYRREHAAE